MLNTRMWRTPVWLLILCIAPLMAQVNAPDHDVPAEMARWSATGGVMKIEFDPGLMDNLGITILTPHGPVTTGMGRSFDISGADTASLEFLAPFSSFQRFVGGGLDFPASLSFERNGQRINIDGFDVRPVEDRALGMFDGAGHELFRLDYIHIQLYPDSGSMELLNMDMAMSAWFAKQLGVPELADMVIAGAHVYSPVNAPAGAFRGVIQGCTTPNWHDGLVYQTDVALIEINRVQQGARDSGLVAISPDAMLQNVGTADVPWYERFETPANGTYKPPYDRDQHPFLVWAMYRIVDDIPEQIGQSAVKHAFNSQNSGCSCGSGGILWAAINTGNGVGCGDLYSYFTNDNPLFLGIRSEIPAFTGEWEQCGSMFAESASPPGPCAQEYDGNTKDQFERRLVVEETELQTADADYLFEAWYVIRDDINIFNSMAHKTVDPEFSGSAWIFNYQSFNTFEGPALTEWVPFNSRGVNQSHEVVTTANGHFSVAVKVTDLGEGTYRYVYALMNYDYDPQFASFSVPLPAGVGASNIQFLDGDSDSENDWVVDNRGTALVLSAPGDVGLEWGYMATFVFEVDAPPGSGTVDLSALELPLSPSATALVPVGPPVFDDGFE